MDANPVEPTKSKAAWDELKLFEDIIARYDGHTFKVKGWAIGVATAIVVFGFATHAALWMTLPGAALALLGVYTVELLFRRVQKTFVKRANTVEIYLRGGSKVYDGPKISDTATQTEGVCKFFLGQCWHPGVWLQYVVLFFVVAGMLWCVNEKAGSPMTEPKEKTALNLQSAGSNP
jgi:hypothetical protein